MLETLPPKDKMVTQTLPPTFVQGFHDETIIKKMEFRKHTAFSAFQITNSM